MALFKKCEGDDFNFGASTYQKTTSAVRKSVSKAHNHNSWGRPEVLSPSVVIISAAYTSCDGVAFLQKQRMTLHVDLA